MVIQILPRDERMGELSAATSNLGEAVGSGIGYLVGRKLAQVRARNAFQSFGVDPEQSERLSRLPMQMRNVMLQDLAERKGYTEANTSRVPNVNFDQLSLPVQQRLGALAAMQMAPNQQASRIQAQPVSSPMMQAQQGAQIPLQQAQAQMAVGGPRGMMQGADQGLQALQQQRQQAMMGYQAPIGQQQQPVQLAAQPPRQPGEAPRPVQTQPGIPPQLPSEAPIRSLGLPSAGRIGQQQGAVDESTIPSQYRGMGLKPYQERNPLVGPKMTPQQRDKEREEWYKKQITEKEGIGRKQQKETKKIYQESDTAKKELGLLEQLSDLNKQGKIQYSAISGANWLGQALNLLGLGEAEGTQEAKNLLTGLSKETKAELGTAGDAQERQKKIEKHIEKAKTAIAKEEALENIIDENNGWVPKNITNLVNQRIKRENQQPKRSSEETLPTSITKPSETNMAYQALAPAVRAAEFTAGLPGNIASLGARGVQYLTGSESPLLESIAENPLTSSSIRENVTKTLTGERFEPSSKASALYQDVIGTALSLAVPGGAASKILTRAAKITPAVVGGKLVGGGLKKLGADPIGQAVGEALATGLFMGNNFINRVRDAKDAAYKAADDIAHTSSRTFSTRPLNKTLGEIYRKISNRDMKGKDILMKRLEGLHNVANKNEGTINDFWNASKDLNSHWGDSPSSIIPYMKELSKEVQAPLYEFASESPAWAESWVNAQRLNTGIEEAKRVANMVREKASLNDIPVINKWVKLARSGQAKVAEIGTLAQSTPQARKLFNQFYARVLAQDFAGAEQKAHQLQKLYDKKRRD